MKGSGSATIRAACAIALLASGCRKPSRDAEAPGWHSKERELYFGIPVAVRFFPGDDALARSAWAYLEGVDDVFNDYRADSEVGRLNAAAGRKGVRVSDDLAEALGLSMRLHEITGGAFDVSVGGLVRLWKKAKKSDAPPPAEAIAAERGRSGLDKVRLDGNTLTIDAEGLALDFGGIVKGIAVDRVVAMLKEAGVRGALVQVGGETACFGNSKRARPHVVGVRHPLDTSGVPRIWTSITDPGTGLSVATSGNYFNPIDIGGKRFYHIFDPRTGRPVSTSTLSVSVAFPGTGKNGLADGLSTACAVLGPDAALALVEKLGGEALFLVDEGGEIRERKTRGWDALARGAPPR
ncbi:MAG: FAD:protein FMN transferase [Planctomycetota bacterium]